VVTGSPFYTSSLSRGPSGKSEISITVYGSPRRVCCCAGQAVPLVYALISATSNRSLTPMQEAVPLRNSNRTPQGAGEIDKGPTFDTPHPSIRISRRPRKRNRAWAAFA
jgi:hypothetical protein